MSFRVLGEPFKDFGELGESGKKGSYFSRFYSIQPENLLAFWPLNERSGTVAINQQGNANRNAAYGAGAAAPTLGQLRTGIGDGNTAPEFDGGDVVNFYTADLNAAFNGQECTVFLWSQMDAVARWTDGAARYQFIIQADGNNFFYMRKSAANNQLDWQYRANGTLYSRSKLALTTMDWFSTAIVVSRSGGYMRAYYNGVQEGGDIAIAQNYAGALGLTQSIIGAANTGGAAGHIGFCAYGAIWNTPLTDDEVLSIGVL